MNSAGARLTQGSKPALDVVGLDGTAGDCSGAFGVGDDDQPLALAEACARGALGRRRDALQRLARDRLVGVVVAHHAPPPDDLAKLHRVEVTPAFGQSVTQLRSRSQIMLRMSPGHVPRPLTPLFAECRARFRASGRASASKAGSAAQVDAGRRFQSDEFAVVGHNRHSRCRRDVRGGHLCRPTTQAHRERPPKACFRQSSGPLWRPAAHDDLACRPTARKAVAARGEPDCGAARPRLDSILT